MSMHISPVEASWIGIITYPGQIEKHNAAGQGPSAYCAFKGRLIESAGRPYTEIVGGNMEYKTIIYEKADRIARITMNRPDKLNALSLELRNEIVDAILRSGDDKEVHVIILKGAGRAFCSGYDIGKVTDTKNYISMGATTREDIDTMYSTIVQNWNAVWNSRKPVIAQVHGYCLAGGTDLALHCDMVVCAEDATLGYPPVRAMGSPPTHMWTYLVGPQRAKYMLLTGNSVDGKKAEEIGLVLKAVPPDKLEEEVNNLAAQMAKIPYGLLAVNKGIVNKAVEMMGRTLVQQLACESDAIGHLDPMVAEFTEIAAKDGLTAALNWRDERFGDYRTKK
jgi:enoyl-CoA hydratase